MKKNNIKNKELKYKKKNNKEKKKEKNDNVKNNNMNKKIDFRNLNKKEFILTIITVIMFIIVFILCYLLFYKYVLKRNFENSVLDFSSKNKKTIFEIKDITFFSNCDVKNKSASSSNFTIENLYQYTDMALFISSPESNKSYENTLKSVYIDNIKFTKTPTLGSPSLYYKNISNFAKSDITDNNLINNRLDFNITNNEDANLDTPTLYNNLANPIVLSYVNSNIKTDYTITDTSSPITYDGTLLKKCDVLLSTIESSLSFDIYITNNLDQEFKCSIYIDIPLETDNETIYDGKVTLKKETNFTFYRYK